MGLTNRFRQAWQLYRTDSQADTLAAIALVATVIVPVAYQLYQLNRRMKR